MFLDGIRIQYNSGVVAGAWIWVLASVVLAAVLWSARFQPLIAGIPAAWFLIRFAPTLLGAPGMPRWYPDWIGPYVLPNLNEGALVVTGLLVTATIGGVLRRQESRELVAESEAVPR